MKATSEKENIKILLASLGVEVDEQSLSPLVVDTFIRALSHKSFFLRNYQELKSSKKQNLSLADYDRLEFLGDAILKFVINSYLFETYQTYRSGKLTSLSAYLLSDKLLTEIGEQLKLEKHIRVGNYIPKRQVIADVLEAILGAYFLSFGIEQSKELILDLYQAYFQLAEEKAESENYKARLQELAQAEAKQLPKYILLKTTGPAHASLFFVEVSFGDKSSLGTGSSKKLAEQAAAKKFLEEQQFS